MIASPAALGFGQYVVDNRGLLLELSLDHLAVTLAALAMGTALGVALGVLAYRVPVLRNPLIGVTGLILTVPSLALYALLIGVLGLGALPVVVALTLYSLLPIVRNTVTGLTGVDGAIVDAAQGMGMGPWRRLARVELPLAWPVILTGVRVSAILIVGIAALGAIVNGPGLGVLITDGLRRIGSPSSLDMALAGTVGVVVLGLLLDLGFQILARLTTPRGIRA